MFGEPLSTLKPQDPFLHRIFCRGEFLPSISRSSLGATKPPIGGGEIITQETVARDGRYQLTVAWLITKLGGGLLHVQSGGHAMEVFSLVAKLLDEHHHADNFFKLIGQ